MKDITRDELQLRAEMWFGADLADYMPGLETIAHIGHVDLLTVSGPAGVGKDTLIRETGYNRVIGDTSREPRENDGTMEQDGVEYHFMQGREVLRAMKAGKFVQAKLVHGNFYGSRGEYYSTDGVAVIDVVPETARELRDMKKFGSIVGVYVVAPSHDTWIQRLDGRGEIAPEDRQKRIREAHTSLTQGLNDDELQFILNDEIANAVDTLKNVAEGRENPSLEKYARNLGRRMLSDLAEDLGMPITIPLS